MAGIFIKWPRLSGVPRDASKDAGRQSHPESDSERAGRQIGQQLEVALPLHGGMPPTSMATIVCCCKSSEYGPASVSAEQINAVGIACIP
jgi:hypothetical protein